MQYSAHLCCGLPVNCYLIELTSILLVYMVFWMRPLRCQ